MDADGKRRRIHGIERYALGAERLSKHSRATQDNRPRFAINDERTGACRAQQRAGGYRFLPRISALDADIRASVGEKYQQSRLARP